MKVATLLVLVALTWVRMGAAAPLPIFDAHVHYNVEATSRYSVNHVLDLWRKTGIRTALVTSRPNDGTRALYEARQSEVRIIPFLRPYVVQPDRHTWFKDPAIYRLVETELKRGIYAASASFICSATTRRASW